MLEASLHQRTPVTCPGCMTQNSSPISSPVLFVTSAQDGGRELPHSVLVTIWSRTVPETG